MKKILAFLMVSMISLTVFAGAKSSDFVVMITKSTTEDAALGSLITARLSSDSVQTIGCAVTANNTQKYTTCYATDSKNVSISCTSTNANIFDAARMINETSIVGFSCGGSGKTLLTGIKVWNNSFVIE